MVSKAQAPANLAARAAEGLGRYGSAGSGYIGLRLLGFFPYGG
jgi:hypothetical protein